jgi:hypothetical protein
MEKFTVEQFQKDFDNLFSRVENGETLIIEDDDKKFLLSPYEVINDDLKVLDEFVKNHKNHDDAC